MSFVDKLLGREELYNRIDRLEDQIQELKQRNERLEEKHAKADKRKKEAVTKKQELEKKIKNKENKIKSLQDKLKRKEVMQDTIEKSEKRIDLSRDDMLSFIEKLKSISSNKQDMYTAHVPPDEKLSDIDTDAKLRYELSLNQLKSIENDDSKTGKIIYYTPSLVGYSVKPPLPLKAAEFEVSKQFNVQHLEEMYNKKVCFVYLSVGGSAVSIFGEEVIESEIISKNIQGQHKKGGFSQSRFENIREEHIDELIDDIVDCTENIMEDVDILCISGNQKLKSKFKETDLYEDLDIETFEKGIDISKITQQEDVEKAYDKFWRLKISNL